MQQLKHDDVRVADFVLGLMSPTEAERFEREMLNDPQLARRAQEWRDQAAPQIDEGHTPQAAMRSRIEASFQPVNSPVNSPGKSNVVRFPNARLEPVSDDLSGLWLHGSILAGVIATVLCVVAFWLIWG